MALFTAEQRPLAEAVSELVYCNPFLPERLACERRALGEAFEPSASVWSHEPGDMNERANIERLLDRTVPLVETARQRLLDKPTAGSAIERRWYEDLVLYALDERVRHEMYDAIERAIAGRGAPHRFTCWKRFCAEFEHYLQLPGCALPSGHDAAHVFACYFQIRRAFSHIFLYLIGSSMPAARLRRRCGNRSSHATCAVITKACTSTWLTTPR